MLFNSEIIAPSTITVRVVNDPARTLIHSLSLLNMTDLRSGFGEWINKTYDAMSPELRRANDIAGQLYDVIEFADEPEDFPALLQRIEQQDFAAALAKMNAHVAKHADTTPDAMLENLETYTATLKAVFDKKGDDCNTAIIEATYAYVINPEAARRFLLDHLATMWSQYLEAEWNRVRPVLLETVAAFEQLDLSDLTQLEAIQLVAGRDMTTLWKEEPGVEELIFVPSTHNGPYVSQWSKDEQNRMFVIYGARIPEGVESFSTELGIRELLIQFSALADDTRLHIVSLLTQHRELCSQDFQQMLSLSQSAASRHLRQLVASGLLNERRRDLNKYFSLNQQRVHETAAAMRMLLTRK